MIKTADTVSSLFEKMTVAEIQEYENKTRLEIEKLKEDLRVMVGERYRDLIEAADTIEDMKDSVENILVHVKNMHSFTTSAKSGRAKEGDTTSNNLIHSQAYYSIATEIKLLVDIPSKIWICIESGDFLKAAQLFLFAQHVHTNLEFEMKHKKDSNSLQFGIITRQWASVVHFRNFILNYCQDVMNSSGLDEQRVAKSICALMCLTDSTPRKLCSDFLVTKMNVLENALSTHRKSANVKEQISFAISSIMETICLVYLIFYPINNGESLLSSIVKSVTDRTFNDLLAHIIPQGTIWGKHVPSSISGFYPTIQMTSNIISEDFLKETCSHWIVTVKQALKSGFTRLLSYINSIKGLATLQESLEDTFLTIQKNETWINACNVLLQKELNIWGEFLSSVFVERIQSILDSQIEKTFGQTKIVLEESFEEMHSNRLPLNEIDICGYIWTEEVGDMPVKFTNKNEKLEKDGGKLTMKVKGYTPRVQHISQNLDLNLKSVLDDLKCFVLSCFQLSQTLSINASTEIEVIKAHLQQSCNNLIRRIVTFIKETVAILTKDEKDILLNRALFLARQCLAFSELCNNLQKGIMGEVVNAKEYTRDSFSSVYVLGKIFTQKAEDYALWNNVTEMLKDESLAMFTLWKNVTCEDFCHRAEELVVQDATHLLKHLPRWDNVEIREESEGGASVNSTISIPMQPSIKLWKLLYWLCLEINKVGGHIIPRAILQQLQCDVLECVVTIYEKYLFEIRESGRFISQTLSLQMSFDVKFVSGLLSMNAKSVLNERIQTLCDALENYVDPFDLDVFSLYINNHLKRCIQRSIILLGPITVRSGIHNTMRSISSNQQEQHNFLALSFGNRTRFTLLPCGIQSSKPVQSKSVVTEENKTIIGTKLMRNQNINEKARSASPIRSSTPPPAEIVKSASSSFFGAMSSSWFGS